MIIMSKILFKWIKIYKKIPIKINLQPVVDLQAEDKDKEGQKVDKMKIHKLLSKKMKIYLKELQIKYKIAKF